MGNASMYEATKKKETLPLFILSGFGPWIWKILFPYQMIKRSPSLLPPGWEGGQ